MAYKVLQVRRDTAANWTSSDPTLSAGEWGHESDTGKIKIGDSSTAWTSLDYIDSSINHDALSNFAANEHFLQSAITEVGTIATGTWEATDVGIAHGGTGASTAQAAINALSAVGAATNEHVLTKDTDSGNAIWKAAIGGNGDGVVVQVVNYQTSIVGAAAVPIPLDDTIPQKTEGTEFMSLAITPTSATNKLKIDVVCMCSVTPVTTIVAGLFQDDVNDALAVIAVTPGVACYLSIVKFTHYMVAGTTSEITFKTRYGPSAAATITINGISGARYWGGVVASSITITEIQV